MGPRHGGDGAAPRRGWGAPRRGWGRATAGMGRATAGMGPRRGGGCKGEAFAPLAHSMAVRESIARSTAVMAGEYGECFAPTRPGMRPGITWGGAMSWRVLPPAACLVVQCAPWHLRSSTSMRTGRPMWWPTCAVHPSDGHRAGDVAPVPRRRRAPPAPRRSARDDGPRPRTSATCSCARC
jgi:hypothetical protein